MEHYFDAARVFALAESTKNATVSEKKIETENFDIFGNLDLPGQIPDSVWPSSKEDSDEHEKYLQLFMLFLVLFFLVRKISKTEYNTKHGIRNLK